MTWVEKLAAFVDRASYDDLSEDARLQIKIRVLDAIGCAIGAMEGEPPRLIRKYLEEFEPRGQSSLIGGRSAPPDSAALYNSALVRYLDFNDAYLAKNETCHPSDNIAAILAAGEYANQIGREAMIAIAVAYQIQCRLSDVAPVRDKGFDHTTQGSYSAAAGVAKILGLNQSATANAIAISGTAFNALRVTRTGRLSHWKGLAFPNTASCATRTALLARNGITGPLEVAEGDKGFMDAIAGKFEIDWSKEDLERITRTIIKRYNAEIHSQAATHTALDIKEKNKFSAADIEHIDIDIFKVAFNIIGGGEEGNKTESIRIKEQADHSLPYIIAAAMLDGDVMPPAYEQERILREDIQQLLRRVTIKPSPAYSERFPQEMPCRVQITLRDGRKFTQEGRDYPGFTTRPMNWDDISKKFALLAQTNASKSQIQSIIGAVEDLEHTRIGNLMRLLAAVGNHSEALTIEGGRHA